MEHRNVIPEILEELRLLLIDYMDLALLPEFSFELSGNTKHNTVLQILMYACVRMADRLHRPFAIPFLLDNILPFWILINCGHLEY